MRLNVGISYSKIRDTFPEAVIYKFIADPISISDGVLDEEEGDCYEV